MRLYQEILQKIGLSEAFSSERCVWVLGGGGYFQGVKSVSEFSEDKVVLAYGSGVLTVLGERFCIDKYEGEDVALSGEISSVAYEPRGKKYAD